MHSSKSELTPGKFRCRQVVEADIDALVSLLSRLFPRRPAAFWRRAFERLAARPAIGDCPRFGYLLECAGKPVGVILLIFSRNNSGAASHVRCNVSSWCVEPDYAAYGSMLVQVATKLPGVTYSNISPAPHTRRTIVAQGFTCYIGGMYAAIPVLSPFSVSAKVRLFDPAADYHGLLSADETELLKDHAEFGCLALVCDNGAEIVPFIFQPRRVEVGPLAIPGVYLCYCRDIDDFRRFAGPLGRALVRRGIPFALVDAEKSIPGVPGWYFSGRGPKYFRGPCAPRLGDVAYTEATLFEPGFC